MLNKQISVKWLISKGLIDYPQAISTMEAIRDEIYHDKNQPDRVWLLEHAPLYTAGISANPTDLLDENSLPLHQTRRGGKTTYHGPGQRVVYLMMDLRRHGKDVRQFVAKLEDWIILTLTSFGIDGKRDSDNIGIWVGGDKIAAIGIQLSRWISAHGIAINLNPDLKHFEGIIPCGIKDKGITSLAKLGCSASMADLDEALKASFLEVFQIPSTNLESQHFRLPDRKSF